MALRTTMSAAVTLLEARREALLLADRYDLLVPLGRGMHGEVWRARDRGDPFARHVCIKRLGSLAPEHARALQEEARLLARVRHANVVSLLDCGEDPPGAPYLVLELVDGVDLRALCEARLREDGAGFVATPVAVHIACALLRALAAIAQQVPGLVHRDVAPSNVLVSRLGEVKLADFGIALAGDRPRWTLPPLVKGKPGYMAPEQIRGEPLDVRADLFCVGIILCELLARRRPWRARGMRELHAVATGAIDPVRSLRPDLCAALTRAVDRLLAFHPHDRFATPEEALRALAPFGAGEVGSARLTALVTACV